MSKQKETSKKCRFCGRCKEHLHHLPSCKILLPVRNLVRRFLKAMGIKRSSLSKSPRLLFGFGLDSSSKVIKCKVTQSLLRLFWRVTYRHLVRISENSLNRWFVTNNIADIICKDLARLFMAKILTYQLTRRIFYRKRRYSLNKEKLPAKAAKEISPIGKLNTKTGKLRIRSKLRDIFIHYECWNDFNSPSIS